MKKNTTKMVAFGGLIAALYVVLTMLAAALGLASGAIQVRLSEALTILPVFTGAAVPGLTVGCVLANLITGCAPWDVVFGSLATLLGAIGTRLLRKKLLVAWIPPVISNMAIVPVVLMKVYGVTDVEVFGRVFAERVFFGSLGIERVKSALMIAEPLWVVTVPVITFVSEPWVAERISSKINDVSVMGFPSKSHPSLLAAEDETVKFLRVYVLFSSVPPKAFRDRGLYRLQCLRNSG